MSERKEFRELVSPERAHEAIASLDLAPEPEEVALGNARGRVLTERIDATIDVPGFDRAAMDGYAVRARDTFGASEGDPNELDLVGTVHAGTPPTVAVGDGEAAEISTGAVLPDGADAVVIVERTNRVERSSTDEASEDPPSADRDGRVAINTAVAPGDSVMLAGADIAAGERALGPGTRVTAREIGLLSALGVDRVPVRGRPRVGVISTGDELVRPGEALDHDAGQIYDVNSDTIAAAIEEAGGDPVMYPHAGDDHEEMERLLREAAAECDLVLSSGSTSASAVDVIYRVIEDRGDLLVHGVAVKPGKPMLVGRLEQSESERGSAGDDPDGERGEHDRSSADSSETSDESNGASGESAYVGLPGYPVSALTIFRTFVAPAIRRAAGLPEARTATVDGRMALQERYAEGRLRLMPVGLVEAGPKETVDDESVGGESLVYPVDKGSGATTSLVEADGIVVVDPDTEYLARGEPVTVQLFSPDIRPPTLFGIGEDDPLLARLLDRLDRPRYLRFGSREGLRRLENGVPDVAVTSGPDPAAIEARELGGWTREWGLVVPEGNPAGVEELADLIDRDLSFLNRAGSSGLRESFEDALADLATERGDSRQDLVESIVGFERTVRAHESSARMVRAGRVDAGLGLRASAANLELEFVPVGEERVRVLANPDRIEKVGVRALAGELEDLSRSLRALPGYRDA